MVEVKEQFFRHPPTFEALRQALDGAPSRDPVWAGCFLKSQQSLVAVVRPGDDPLPMTTPSPRGLFWQQLRSLVRLAAPIALAHFGLILLGMVDTAIVGRLGERELGAVGLGNAVFFGFAIFGLGLMLGIDPIISQALGAERPGRARATMWQGVWLAGLASIPLMLMAVVTVRCLPQFGIEPATAELAADYVYARLPGLVCFLLATVAQVYLQAITRVRPMLVAAALANVINLPLNWLLVFGDAGLTRLGLAPVGMPALGVVGAGYTSSVAMLVQFLVVAMAVRGVPCPEPYSIRPQGLLARKAIGLGIPIGLQRFAEVGIFSLAGLLMGRLGTRAVASHQVAMMLASATFMVPLGISAAAAVLVGRAVGSDDQAGVRRAGLASMTAGTIFMTASALTLVSFPELLIGLLTNQPAVIAATVPLLRIAALFQISDGLQVVAAGALRGAGDTQPALYLNLFGHYAVGVPLGIYLAFFTPAGASGLWWGMFTGLTVVGLSLLARFIQVTAKPVSPV